MFRLILVGMANDNFSKMVKALRENDEVELVHTDTGGDALDSLKEKSPDLAVAAEQLLDMSGLTFAEKLVVQNPAVNCALVSSLSETDFHEASEGLGILSQLPSEPDASDAASLLNKLKVITGRTG